ncbi:Hypothetical predicted protein [Octopus vulgaris]|uniref:Uncharacterized protein n=1 Tax=Octopus vulgaris TaxID=6645 RepID=A0AA36FFB6_OCTVU|nr:Hypothetical predicted protein [Octopus vulgaris]
MIAANQIPCIPALLQATMSGNPIPITTTTTTAAASFPPPPFNSFAVNWWTRTRNLLPSAQPITPHTHTYSQNLLICESCRKFFFFFSKSLLTKNGKKKKIGMKDLKLNLFY